ncbi:ATP-dependent DNA helicase RecG [Candidatus Calescamantes bacterium]|nr:ATP-dependent DNA helicase RecG [Candidatus Calescamantes bacterium]
MNDKLLSTINRLLKILPYEAKNLRNTSVMGGFNKFCEEELRKITSSLSSGEGVLPSLKLIQQRILQYPTLPEEEKRSLLLELQSLLEKLREEITLHVNIQKIKGIGKKTARELEKLGICSVKDLLYHFPRGYEDRRKITRISQVKPGEKVTIQGKIVVVGEERTRKGKKIFRAIVDDGTGKIVLTWFYFKGIKEIIKPGKEGIFTGRVSYFSGLEIIHPEFELWEEEKEKKEFLYGGRIIPFYPATTSLTQGRLRQILYRTVKEFAPFLFDPLPPNLLKKYALPSVKDAIREIHFPTSVKNLKKARLRFAWEELFLFQLGILSKRGWREKEEGSIFNASIWEDLNRILPFTLTPSQRKVLEEIRQDLTSGKRMYRLLQGDVGSGKTVVALGASLMVLKHGYQVAFLAPTHILAEQHYWNFIRFLAPLGFEVVLITGKEKKKAREEVIEKIRGGEANVVIGTHSLLNEEIVFKNLGLVVIDEQHRFGVVQRSELIKKGEKAHVLVMSATPIPRSLALALYGEMDISTLEEIPGGKREVETYWLKEEEREKIFPFILEEIGKGRLIYYVVPRIKDKNKEMESLERIALLLEKRLPQVSLGVLHGRLKKEKQKKILDDFRKGKIQILLSTPVIEVGIDVPDATVMVIENAERFGLSQLHQLRGRVGRGKYPGYCFLIGTPQTPSGGVRLEKILTTQDGFQIAEEDLKLRGPGELLGTLQHGFKGFRVVNILKAVNLLEKAREEAKRFMKEKNLLPLYLKIVKERFPEWEETSLT